MKFFGSRIITKSVSLEDAIAKAKEPQKVRTLDEILAEIDANNKQVKTASSEPAEPKKAEAKAEEKVEKKAEAEQKKTEAKAEAKAEEKAEKKAEAEPKKVEEKKAESNVSVKVAKELPDFIKEKMKDKGGDGDEKDEKKDKKDKKEEKEEGCTASAIPPQKWAKSLDFRGWAAADVVSAWEQHGNAEKCAANVKGKVSDPKVYCELLKTASATASKMIKAAEANGKQQKTANVFKKIAKLTDEQKSWLADYYRELYGNDYVDALLADY